MSKSETVRRVRPSQLMVVVLLILVLPPVRPPSSWADEEFLSQRQSVVADRYQRLEELLLRLADVEVAENPERSALLRRAARQSRDRFVLEKLKVASESIRTQEFQRAVENQETAEKELGALLTLLLSEDRSKRIRDEKERIAKLIKDLKRNLNNQRSTRARTENGAELEELKDEQESVTERSQELKDRLAEENKPIEEQSSEDPAEDPKPNEGEQQQGPDQEQSEPAESSEAKPSENPPSEQSPESQQGQTPPSESKQNESKPSESQPSESKPGESQQQDSPPSDASPGEPQDSQQQSEKPQTAEQEVESQLEQAIEKMREAEEELEQARREQATEKQREAEENLRAAIDRLERILRQLREEEMQRELAKLEARLRKMVAMQTKVLDDTVSLSATPATQRNRQTDLKAGDLAFEEKKITLEADRAMLLLREEGSSVAFPEVVDQIRNDTSRVADRLGQTKIDAVTQGIQQDILAALEEMITALQKAQRDLEQKRQQQQQGQQQQSQQKDQPLVEVLAELKLIRTMETRIKSTTERYSGLLESNETAAGDILPLLQDLSERQNRLYRITRDLVMRRNK